MKETYKLQYRSILPQAVGIFHFKVNDILSFLIESGMMEYAFNPEVKNLGNYLHRSTAYPLNLSTKLDYIYSNLMGIRFETGLFNERWKIGWMINSILNQAPFFDMNMSWYMSYITRNKVFEAGVGLMAERVMAINDTLTDCIRLRSTLGDTTLTLRGQKLNGRLTFDVKQLFDNNSIFGANDAKIYTEAAILGFKDPEYYPDDTLAPKPDLLHRIPLMIGINLPAFKILDVFNIEVEWCAYPYSFDWWGATRQAPSPKPHLPSDSTMRDNYENKDNFKWSFYFKKSISKFDVIAFFANDHIRYETYNAESQFFTEQSLRTRNNWHWYAKLQYNL
ncbi:MAG: hypothetical protein JW913_03670 [Chitinispirillaceae bacterium]|nr:hypothetical protein [Chitinispirillaceae bacterium]